MVWLMLPIIIITVSSLALVELKLPILMTSSVLVSLDTQFKISRAYS